MGHYIITGQAGTLTAAPAADAPNILSSGTTVSVVSQTIGYDPHFAFQVTIALPTSDPNYGHLKEIDVTCAELNDQVTAALYHSDWSGSTVTFTSKSYVAIAGSYTLTFDCLNEDGNKTASPITKTVTVTAAQVSSATANEVANSVYQDTNGGLHMAVSVAATITAGVYPQRVRVWLDYDDGNGWTLQGDQYAASSPASWVFGAQSQQTGVTVPGTIWVPTDPTKVSWKAAAECNSNASQPSGSAATYNFTVTAAQPTSPTAITSIQFVPNPTTGDTITYALADVGVYYWIFNELDYTQPATSATIAGGDPYFKSSFCTVQLGYSVTGTCNVTGGVSVQLTSGTALASDVGNMIHLGSALVRIASYTDSAHVTINATSLNGVAVVNGAGQSYEIWRPAPADSVNGIQGQDDPDAQAQGYWGRRFTDGPPPSVLGSTTAQFIGTPSWTIPPSTLPNGTANLYLSFRFWVFGVSRLADNETGGTNTVTLQAGWPGAADHGDLIPAAQTAALDLTKSKASTLGAGLGKEFGTGKPKLNASATVGTDGSNNVVVNPSSLGNVHILPGELGADLSKWTASASPWGIYFGLPSPFAANIPNIIINTAETPWRIYNKVAGAWIAQSTRPGDLVAGTIAALVSILAPTIVGGSISGTTLALALNGITTTIANISDAIAGANIGLKVLDGSGNYVAAWARGVMARTSTMTPYVLGNKSNGLWDYGSLALNAGGGGKSIILDAYNGASIVDGAISGTGITGLIPYVKPGGASGNIIVSMGWIVGFT